MRGKVMTALAEWFVAGLGTTAITIVVFPTASGTMLLVGTMMSVFG